MIMRRPESGYREIEHTADWELEVWAPDLTALLEQAARGMYALSGMHLHPDPRQTRRLEIQSADAETLLVAFLSELLYYGEHEKLGFDRFNLSEKDFKLLAELVGAPIARLDKEIKAVTYHNLAIRQTQNGFEANVVFDV